MLLLTLQQLESELENDGHAHLISCFFLMGRKKIMMRAGLRN